MPITTLPAAKRALAPRIGIFEVIVMEMFKCYLNIQDPRKYNLCFVDSNLWNISFWSYYYYHILRNIFPYPVKNLLRSYLLGVKGKILWQQIIFLKNRHQLIEKVWCFWNCWIGILLILLVWKYNEVIELLWKILLLTDLYLQNPTFLPSICVGVPAKKRNKRTILTVFLNFLLDVN